jgi:hypothetical protein
MTASEPKDVEIVGHRYRGRCRPGAEAGSHSWDTGAKANVGQRYRDFTAPRHHIRAPGRIRTKGVQSFRSFECDLPNCLAAGGLAFQARVPEFCMGAG